MKQIIIHQSLVRDMGNGSRLTTTLCGRMNNHLEDGINVGGEVTCKFCLKNMKTHWGKTLLERSIK